MTFSACKSPRTKHGKLDLKAMSINQVSLFLEAVCWKMRTTFGIQLYELPLESSHMNYLWNPAIWTTRSHFKQLWVQKFIYGLDAYSLKFKIFLVYAGLERHMGTVAYPGGGVWGVSNPLSKKKFRRPFKIVPNSTRLWKLLKIAEFRTPAPQDVRKKGSKILKLPRFAIVLH